MLHNKFADGGEGSGAGGTGVTPKGGAHGIQHSPHASFTLVPCAVVLEKPRAAGTTGPTFTHNRHGGVVARYTSAASAAPVVALVLWSGTCPVSPAGAAAVLPAVSRTIAGVSTCTTGLGARGEPWPPGLFVGAACVVPPGLTKQVREITDRPPEDPGPGRARTKCVYTGPLMRHPKDESTTTAAIAAWRPPVQSAALARTPASEGSVASMGGVCGPARNWGIVAVFAGATPLEPLGASCTTSIWVPLMFGGRGYIGGMGGLGPSPSMLQDASFVEIARVGHVLAEVGIAEVPLWLLDAGALAWCAGVLNGGGSVVRTVRTQGTFNALGMVPEVGDPNRAVALKALGALAHLSQNITSAVARAGGYDTAVGVEPPLYTGCPLAAAARWTAHTQDLAPCLLPAAGHLRIAEDNPLFPVCSTGGVFAPVPVPVPVPHVGHEHEDVIAEEGIGSAGAGAGAGTSIRELKTNVQILVWFKDRVAAGLENTVDGVKVECAGWGSPSLAVPSVVQGVYPLDPASEFAVGLDTWAARARAAFLATEPHLKPSVDTRPRRPRMFV